jgi:hypothetical protein
MYPHTRRSLPRGWLLATQVALSGRNKQVNSSDSYKLHEKEEAANVHHEIRFEICSRKEPTMKKFVWTCRDPNMQPRVITEKGNFHGASAAKNWRIKKLPEKPGSKRNLDSFPLESAGERPNISLQKKIKINITSGDNTTSVV